MSVNEFIHPKVWEEPWEDIQGIRFCAGGYEAFLVPQMGGNLIQLIDHRNSVSLLRNIPDTGSFKARPHVFGIPVLFPPNRIAAGTFNAGGVDYSFPVNDSSKENHIHGFLRHRAWEVFRAEVEDSGVAVVEIITRADTETEFYQYFPHAFEFRIQYRLSSEGLRQKVSITNQSASNMPFGLGFHTAFNMPFHPESKEENCKLIVSIGEKWELNEQCMPSGKLLALTDEEQLYRNGGRAIAGKAVLDHFTADKIILDRNEFSGAMIVDEDQKLRLVYETDQQYKHWMIWNDTGDKGFVCPEPQTWAVNAPNLNLPEELTGFQWIAPGVTWEAESKIYMEKI